MNKVPDWISCAVALCIGGAAHANVDVTFVESAPKDRFVVTNVGSCALQDLLVAIDMSDSAGGLIFDTTGDGAGVEVFQPFELRSGDLALVSSDTVQDGDVALSIRIDSLPVGESVSFTIDVDDTLANSELGQIRVAGSEIAGGAIEVSALSREPVLAEFDASRRAVAQLPNCHK